MRLLLIILCLLISLAAFAQPELTAPDPAVQVEKLLLELKNAPDTYQRMEAAKKLGELGFSEAVPGLIEALNEESMIAQSAAKALETIGDRRAVSALLKALHFRRDDDANRAVMQALITFADPAMKIPALDMLYEPWRPAMRVLALDALESLHDPTVADAVLPVVDSAKKTPGVSARAGLLVARLGDQRVTPKLIPMLSRPELIMRKTAAEGLSYLRDATAIEPLRKALSDDEPVVRGLAVRALAGYRTAELCTSFVPLLKDEDAAVRAQAAAALGACGNTAAISPLISSLRDSNAGVRAAAAEALGASPAAGGQLLPLLADPSPDVRAAVAQALGAVGKADAAGKVAQLLADSDRTVRDTACIALSRMKPAPVSAVLPLLASKSPEARASAARTLGLLRADFPTKLAALLADPAAEARCWAVWALGRSPRGIPEEPVLAGLKDIDIAVRCEAARVAGERKIRSAFDSLLPLLRSHIPQECVAAHDALCEITGKDYGLDPNKWREHREN